MRHRLYLSIYFIFTSVIALICFGVLESSFSTAIILLMIIYLLPIAYALTGEVKLKGAILLLVSTPLLGLLLVIDPVEIGMFGHDPYYYSGPAYHQVLSGQIFTPIKSGSYPLTYVLTTIIIRVIDIQPDIGSKYIPLISAALPFLIFTALHRYISVRYALVGGMVAASTRTLLLFESKFVDEITAVVLTFVLILILLIPSINLRKSVLGLIAVFAISIAHHAIFFLACTFITIRYVIYIMSNIVEDIDIFPIETVKQPSTLVPTPISLLLLGMLAIVVPFFGGVEFLAYVTEFAITSLTGNMAPPDGGGITTSSKNPLELLSAFLTISLFSLTLYTSWRIARTKSYQWEIVWFGFIGFLGVLYALSLIAGRLLPLDPIRFLIFIVPLLGGLTLSKQRNLSIFSRRFGALLVAILLIIPNLAAIPPHVLMTDISHKPGIAEGHYTESQWSASSWAAEFNRKPIAAYENGLWTASGSEAMKRQWATCARTTFVERASLGNAHQMNNTIYTNSEIILYKC